jgi:hypothetical protein
MRNFLYKINKSNFTRNLNKSIMRKDKAHVVDELKTLNFNEKLEMPTNEKESPKPEYENYACLYYKFFLNKDFDLFSLRNLIYSYIFTKQRKGKIFLNINDTLFEVTIKLTSRVPLMRRTPKSMNF